MSIQSIWNIITNNGIDSNTPGREIVKIRLLNQLITLACFTSILAMITYVVNYNGMTIIYTTLTNIAFEITGIILAYKQRHLIVRFLSCFIFPLFITNNILILGGGFGEANIFTAIALMTFILYEGSRKIQIFGIAYISFLFITSKLYVIQVGTAANIATNPYDEIVTFPMVLVILGLILLLYQKELLKYENQKNTLIQDLEQKNRDLKQINKELEQFTYIASHDLKTPIRTISGHLDLLKVHLKKNEPQAVQNNIQSAKEGVNQLYALVRDILEYKDISQGEKHYSAVDLNKILGEVQQSLKHHIETNNALITTDNLPVLHVDKKEMFVLFQNLISNGLKYNHATTPTIQINHHMEEEWLYFDFKDNGIGIAPEYHDKVFQFFRRLHTVDNYEGTGMGLGLCQKIVHNYGGKIEITSKEGEGSSFTVTLPSTLLLKI